MSKFNTNMQILNKLSPTVKISYSKIRGSFETRQNNATKMVDKLYKEILPKFNKHGYITMETLHNSVSKVLNKNINISIRKNNDAIFDGGNDILYSEFTGKISKTTIDINTIKNKINRESLITILHEFQHVVDGLFHPKYLSRNQKMANDGLYTKKYDILYDDLIYTRDFPDGKKDKKYILNRLRHKIEHFFRGMPADVKMDYIQDAKYCLLSEKYAYSTQRKYAKIAKKKHFPFNADELENENKNFMFDEKIKLLKDMGFEIIKKERSEHARKLKEHKKLTNVKTK